MEIPPDDPTPPATLDDLLALPDQGRGHEIINGKLVKKDSSPEQDALRQRLRSTMELVALIDSTNRQSKLDEDE
jgi:hypothetical protein